MAGQTWRRRKDWRYDIWSRCYRCWPHHGILTGYRRPRGGYRLAREPSDISVEDIPRSIGSMEDDSLLNEVVLPAWLLRDLCFGKDLTYFFVAEWRAEDVHADVAGDIPQLGHVTGKKAPPLDLLEEAFETAGGNRHREANSLGTIGPPGVRTELRQKNQITRCKNEGKIRRPNDYLTLDQFKNLVLPVMKMSRRPEAGRSAIVKNGELPPAVGGANPDTRFLAPRCPRHNARRCCSINRDRTRSNSLGRHACSFLLLMRDSLTPVRDLQPLAERTCCVLAIVSVSSERPKPPSTSFSASTYASDH
jgi:hypothetical protein